MAFFLLMWLSTDSSQAERSAIAAYFTGADPEAHQSGIPVSVASLETILTEHLETDQTLASLREHIHLVAEPNGLRIDLTDSNTGSLFTSGASELNPRGETLVRNIGRIITPMPLNLTIEGHTDAFKTAPAARSNWDISSARASHALTLLQEAGIAPDRFVAITGLAATRPLLPTQPHAAINRRISILLELSH